jgi:hypothetical protein
MRNPLRLLVPFFAILNNFRSAEAERMFTSLAGTNIDFIFNGTVNCSFTGMDPRWDMPIIFSVPDSSNLSGSCQIGSIPVPHGETISCTMNTSTPMRGNFFGTASGAGPYPIIVNCEATKIGPSTPFSSSP